METIVHATMCAGHRSVQARIKQALGSIFPATRFRYYTGYGQGCCRIRIRYVDGASLTRVKSAVRGFNKAGGVNTPRTEVIVERQMSGQVRHLLLHEIQSVFKLDGLPQEQDPFTPIKGTVGDYMRKIFNMRDF